MIRVTVEILPYGSEQNRRTLGTMDIVNDSSGTVERGNYIIHIGDEYVGRIENYWRNRGFWTLVKQALGEFV